MANRKPLALQKGHLTTEKQEELKNTEEKLEQLQSIQINPPDWLDELAQEEYKRIIPLLQELKIADLDLALVSTYCQTYSNYIQATQHINKHGLVTVTERGTKLSSYYTVQRDSAATLNTIGSKLGLNLDSRMKLLSVKEEKEEVDEFKEMMNND